MYTLLIALIHHLCTSPNIITAIKTRMKCTGYVACMGAMRNAYKILAGKPEGERPLQRPNCRWKDNMNVS
jgi:hypothetical protein